MEIHLKAKYVDEPKAELRFGRYGDKSIGLEFYSELGEPLAKATVSLVDYGVVPGENEVFIKDVREGEGMFACLVEQGVIMDTGKTHEYGYGGQSVVRVGVLTPAAIDELRKQEA